MAMRPLDYSEIENKIIYTGSINNLKINHVIYMNDVVLSKIARHPSVSRRMLCCCIQPRAVVIETNSDMVRLHIYEQVQYNLQYDRRIHEFATEIVIDKNLLLRRSPRVNSELFWVDRFLD